MNAKQLELNQTLKILEGLANKAVILNMNGEYNSDLQKAIVGIIRGSEFAFEELTGVKYHLDPTEEERIFKSAKDPEDTIPN